MEQIPFCLVVLLVSMSNQAAVAQAPCPSSLLVGPDGPTDAFLDCSSQWWATFNVERARLTNRSGRAWMSYTSDLNQYIEVKFMKIKSVVAIATKGRQDKNQYVSKYRVLYSMDGSNWNSIVDEQGIEKVFDANSDNVTLVTNDLPVAINAKFIRINPIEWYDRIAMRLEIIGCSIADVCDSNPCMNGATCDSCIGCSVDFFCHCVLGFTGDLCEEDMTDCLLPQVKNLPGDKITASSYKDETFRPEFAKLSYDGCWTSEFKNADSYIQVNVSSGKTIIGVTTRACKPGIIQWTEKYKIFYSLDAYNWDVAVDSNGEDLVLNGNIHNAHVATNALNRPITARYLRINPIEWYADVSINLELYGCDADIPEVCDSAPCQNGGSCSPCPPCDLRYECQCPEGYSGTNCEEVDPCKPNPCQNEGTCKPCEDCVEQYKCKCTEGYEGDICELEIPEVCDSAPCQNGGSCSPCPSCDLRYECQCTEGYSGTNCEELDPCQSNPCQNGGTCNVCEDCAPQYSCQCTEGNSGELCEIVDPCKPNPCQNDGTCKPCKDCEEQYKCKCTEGYEGDICELVDPCKPNPCQNEGKCKPCDDCLEQYKCKCTDGYVGNICELDDPCVINPCLNGGSCDFCENCASQYSCRCTRKYSGNICEFRVVNKRCTSKKSKEKICSIKQTKDGYVIVGLSVQKQLSEAPCIENESYFIHEHTSIRITDGCSARFQVELAELGA